MIGQIGDNAPAGELDRGLDRRQLSRLCAATHTVRPIADLIRFVVGPIGEAVPDVKNKLPGRGIWVTATRPALEDAIKRKVFARGFKRDVRLPADLILRTEISLERAALDALAIAGKAGTVLAGFTKAETALEKGEVAALLHAAEAAADGKRKLEAAVAPPAAGSAAADHYILYGGPIGFGITPPKCGTCSPARRPSERDLFGALSAP
jgi:predicted RNA-binding protein YlxR (DUF448 family)